MTVLYIILFYAVVILVTLMMAEIVSFPLIALMFMLKKEIKYIKQHLNFAFGKLNILLKVRKG